jgi:hypothetical protein
MIASWIVVDLLCVFANALFGLDLLAKRQFQQQITQ